MMETLTWFLVLSSGYNTWSYHSNWDLSVMCLAVNQLIYVVYNNTSRIDVTMHNYVILDIIYYAEILITMK